MDAGVDYDVDFSITVVRQKPIVAAIDAIDGAAWVDIVYTNGRHRPGRRAKLGKYRLIVRRTKIVEHPALPTLSADSRHHAFVTRRTGDAVILDVDHRAHAVVELAIPSSSTAPASRTARPGVSNANAAWLVATTLADNLVRWTQVLGTTSPRLRVAKTLRRRLLALPGRITRSARRWTLPADPLTLARRVRTTLKRLRALPAIG